ncbi:MAG: PP2C family protein-serine/threonine phosphatase [Planctomycetota bacterium]
MPADADASTTRAAAFVEILRGATHAEEQRDFEFHLLERVRSLFGAELFMSIAAGPADRGGYRIMHHADLPDGPMDIDEAWETCLWPDFEAVEPTFGGVLSQLIQHDRPCIVTLEGSPGDPILQGPRRSMTHAMVLPIYRGGAATEWVLFLRAGPFDVTESDLVIIMQICNMTSLLSERWHLLDAVRGLNARLSQSLSSIVDAQRTLMPPEPPAIDGVTLAAWYQPSEEVGGDYYDFREFGDGSFGTCVADVSGHGPPASVAMGMLRSALLANRAYGRPPSTVITDINRVMYDALMGVRFVTALFVQFYPATGAFQYANAGHHPPRVRRADGSVAAIAGAACPPLGVLEHLETPGVAGTLGPGECMVMFTDGVTEAFDDDHEMFGLERLDAVIRDAEPEPDAIAEAIRDAVGAFSGGQPADDRCVLVVRRDG